jgi:hypothetical protein
MRRITAIPIVMTTGLVLAACGSNGGKSPNPTASPVSSAAASAGPSGTALARWLLNEAEGPANAQVARRTGAVSPVTLTSGDAGCDVINKDTNAPSAASVSIGYVSAPGYIFSALDFPTSPSPQQIKAALATCHHFNTGADVSVKPVTLPAIAGINATDIVGALVTESKGGSVDDVSVLIEADINGVKYTAQAGAHVDTGALTAAAANKNYLPTAVAVLETQRQKVEADGKGTHPITVS